MRKRILAIIFAVLLTASVFCGCKKVEDANGGSQEIAVPASVQTIIDSYNMWVIDIEPYAENEATTFSYCITDLDQNGRMELITTVDNSSITKTKYFELNEEMNALLELECVMNSDRQVDISDQTKYDGTCYKDEETNHIYYVYSGQKTEKDPETGVKNDYEVKVAMSVFEGKAYEECLATKATLRTLGEDEAEIVYTDSDGNIITAEEYETIGDKRFSSMKKMKASFDWKGFTRANHARNINPEGKDLSILFTESYYGFKIE